jgi:hypothetical protein
VGELVVRLANLAGRFGFAFHHHIQKSPFRQPLFWVNGKTAWLPIDQLKIARAEGSAGDNCLCLMNRWVPGRQAQDTYN